MTTGEARVSRVGRVISTKMMKTVVVEVERRQRHRLYGKVQRRISKFYVDDPHGRCKLGDLVKIEESRPISKMKHWRLLDIIERREVPEVQPIELDREVLASVGSASAAPAAESADPAASDAAEETGESSAEKAT